MNKYLVGIFILFCISVWAIYADRPTEGLEVNNITETEPEPEVIPYTEENLDKIKNLHLFARQNKVTRNDNGSLAVLWNYRTYERFINPEPYALSEYSCEVVPVNTVYSSFYPSSDSEKLREFMIATTTPLALSVKKRLENDTKNIALCKEKKKLEEMDTLRQKCSKPIRQITLGDYKQCKDNNLIK